MTDSSAHTPLFGINAEDAEEYTQSLAQVGAGWWRQRALGIRLGVHQSLRLSIEEWSERLGGYVRMAIPERREAVVELANEGFTQRETAAILGISQPTVNRDLAPDSSESEVPTDTWPDLPKQQTQSLAPDSSESEVPLFDEPEAEPAREPEPVPNPSLRAQVNEGDEWYTPRWLFDALGVKFSIDVCAPLDLTHTSVPAELHFSIEDDGLAQPWHGTVWCNPPYSKPEPWARRMIHHRDGLMLTHMPMNAGWCVDTWEACDAIRLFQAMEFVRPDGSVQRPGYWLQLTAFGPVATEALSRLQPLGEAAANKRRVASPMWRRAA